MSADQQYGRSSAELHKKIRELSQMNISLSDQVQGCGRTIDRLQGDLKAMHAKRGDLDRDELVRLQDELRRRDAQVKRPTRSAVSVLAVCAGRRGWISRESAHAVSLPFPLREHMLWHFDFNQGSTCCSP